MLAVLHEVVELPRGGVAFPVSGDSLRRMAEQRDLLEIERCPHCNVDKPMMISSAGFQTDPHTGGANMARRIWRAYHCKRCGGAVLTASVDGRGAGITEMYPATSRVAEEIPDRARAFLLQCQATIHAPAASVVVAASAVDAMLKAKGLGRGSLYTRIKAAVAKQLITPEMAAWAHEVRLDANDQRHADPNVALPSEADAKRSLDFALALAEYLFVLPSRVARGRSVQ